VKWDIVIEVGDERFQGQLVDTNAPETVRRIIEALPVRVIGNTWGDEVYFEIPVDAEPENAVPTVHLGDLGYWPAGRCFCIFYGRTPMSTSDDEIVPASAVNLIGTLENSERLKGHAAGERVTVKLAD